MSVKVCENEVLRTRSWFMPDQRFLVPKCYVFLKFSSAQAYRFRLFQFALFMFFTISIIRVLVDRGRLIFLTAYLIPHSIYDCSFPALRTARECNINNLMVYALKDQLTEFSYTASTAGLFYSLKPTKFGFQLCAEGFSEKMGLLISSIVEAVYRCDFTADQLKTVLEVHRKALQSCAAEPLRNQSRYLLNALLSARVWTREQRLAAMENIDQQQVGSFGRNFLDSHSVECLFYGNISKQQVRSGG